LRREDRAAAFGSFHPRSSILDPRSSILATIMASPFQQQSLYRKLIYFGLVVGLFTVSLLHRKLIINTQAEELRLRQVDQGEVAVTDTAMRLSLSGLRGVAVTSLWLSAMERQKKHEWSELEVLVRSLTKLQPHYISPWLYQGWNLAFNVSVECDRSRDKYFYISRGIELLAEGERKNRGKREPRPGTALAGQPRAALLPRLHLPAQDRPGRREAYPGARCST